MAGREETGRSRGLAELRQLTVVRCDLVDSTATQERLGTERYWRLQQAFLEHCEAHANESGAERVRFTGDGFAFAFGRLRAGEDDVARAIRFGLSLVESTRQLNPFGTPIAVRVSVATGEAVVELETDLREATQPLLTGPVLNLSARLLNQGLPNQVVASELSYQLAGREFRCTALGVRALKGFSQPQPCWLVEAPVELSSRFDARRHEPGILIGREHERRNLVELIERVSEGAGTVISMVGDPGIGKSRLVRWLLDEATPDSWSRAQLDCHPNHLGSQGATALEPVSRYLRTTCEILPDEGEDQVSTKVAAFLAGTVGAATVSAGLIQTLVRAGQDPDASAAPDALRRRRLTAVAEHFLKLSEQSPLALVFEDVHWADVATLSLVREIASRVHEVPMLLIIVCREPDFQGGDFANVMSEIDMRAHVLRLSTLDSQESALMVRDLAANAELESEVVDYIVAHSEGVPLFIESLTHEELESGRGRPSQPTPEFSGVLMQDVPKALWDVLMSRLDRLVGFKRSAQIASVLGREFSVPLLSEMLNLSKQTAASAIEQLIEAGIVRSTDHGGYQFRHALLRDVAYASLLESDRGSLHQRIAGFLNRQGDATDQSTTVQIAQHYELASRYGVDVSNCALAASRYWCEAAKQSSDRSEIEECVQRLGRAEALLDSVVIETDRDAVALEIWTERAYVESTYRGWSAHQVGDALHRGFAICERLQEPSGIFDLYMIAGGYHLTLGEIRLAATVGRRCLDLASSSSHASSRNTVIAHRSLAGSSFLLGEHQRALEYINEGLALCEQLDADGAKPERRMGADAMAVLLIYRELISLSIGYVDDAVVIGRASVERAQTINHGNSVAFAKTFLASTHYHRQDPEALTSAKDAFEFATNNRFATFVGASQMMVGHSLVKGGDIDEGLAELSRGAQGHAQIEADTYQPFGLALATSAHLTVGNPQLGLSLTDRALDLMKNTEEYWYRPEISRLRGQCAAEVAQLEGSDPLAAAVPDFEASASEAAAQGARFWHLRTAVSHAALLHKYGHNSSATDLLSPLIESFQEGEIFPDLTAARLLAKSLL